MLLKYNVPKSQVTRRVGGWVGGGLQVHNHATSWPNLQDGTCKNSIEIEFQVGPECGNIPGVTIAGCQFYDPKY